MRNRYGGRCYRCRQWVNPGEGHFERQGRVWLVQHARCAVAQRGSAVGRAKAEREASLAQAAREFGAVDIDV